VTGAVKTDTANLKENTVKEEIGMTLLICLYPVRKAPLQAAGMKWKTF
jgi:hypothetical protein